MRFVFIEAEKARFPVAFMCRKLEVSRSGFYAWCRRPPSERARRDQQLAVKISAAHAENRGVYGRPRITQELKAQGEAVSEKRVGRLMREQGLSGQRPRRFRRTTDSKHDLPVAPNLLERKFNPECANQVWAADISYVRTWEGWLYLAVVLDLFSRRVVGWAIADHMRTELVSDALTMALDHRQPGPGVIHHSDRGSQYASNDYQALVAKKEMVCSMSRKGDCWDNSVVESFFGTLKDELIYRGVWPTRSRARAAINEYIACFYNSRRRNSASGDVSPMEYETRVGQQMLAAA